MVFAVASLSPSYVRHCSACEVAAPTEASTLHVLARIACPWLLQKDDSIELLLAPDISLLCLLVSVNVSLPPPPCFFLSV